MSETASGFTKRMGSELKSFATNKGRELKGRLQEGAERAVSMADQKAYSVALNLIAKHFGLTPEEVESRLTRQKARARKQNN